MTIKEIIRQWLVDHGYDGLCYDDCGCGIDDLMPCCECHDGCVPAYKGPGNGEYDNLYYPTKEARDAAVARAKGEEQDDG